MRQILRLEYLLLLIVNGMIISSLVNFVGHTPYWLLLFISGLAGIIVFRYPKKTGTISFILLLMALLLFLQFDSIQDYIKDFGEKLLYELYDWNVIYGYPGPIITLLISGLLALIMPLIQLYYQEKYNSVSVGTVFLGLALYIWLWFQHYHDAEKELLRFLSISVPLSALLYLGQRSRYSKSLYKIGIVSMGVVTMALVSLFPHDLGPMTFEAGYELVERYFPEIHDLRGAGNGGIDGIAKENGIKDEGDYEEITERQVGYQPGGPLGGALTASEAPVAELTLESGSFPTSLYLRGRVSDYYDGFTWQTVDSHEVAELQDSFQYVDIYEQELEVTVEYYQEQSDIFGLFPTREIMLSESRNEEETFISHSESVQELEVDSYGNLKYSNGNYQDSYRLKGKVVTQKDINELDPVEELEKESEELQPFMQVYDGLPDRVVELSNEITADADNDLEKINEVESYLAQEYEYQTDMPPHSPDDDFVDQFLFEHQAGYCTHFASAMAILLRVQEVPVRYVEGYRVPYYPEEDEHLDVDIYETREVEHLIAQENHAHAWVEVFLQGYGWVTFEPTQPYALSVSLLDGESDRDVGDQEQESEVDREADEQALSNIKTILWSTVVIVISILFISLIIVFIEVYKTKSISDLYIKLILFREVFKAPLEPGETPGKILDEFKNDIPEIADKFQLLKILYQHNCYSGSEVIDFNDIGKRQRNLIQLSPLIADTIKEYRNMTDLMSFTPKMIKFSFLLLRFRLRILK